MTKMRFLAALGAGLLPAAAFAHDGMHINDAYARSANPVTGAVFLRLENHRDVACTLQAVSSDAADRVELHTHREEDGVMRMVPIDGGITVRPHETHDLARGGDHVMLMGMKAPLADGDTIHLIMDFGDCGTEEVDAVVDNGRAAMPAMGGGAGHAAHGAADPAGRAPAGDAAGHAPNH